VNSQEGTHAIALSTWPTRQQAPAAITSGAANIPLQLNPQSSPSVRDISSAGIRASLVRCGKQIHSNSISIDQATQIMWTHHGVLYNDSRKLFSTNGDSGLTQKGDNYAYPERNSSTRAINSMKSLTPSQIIKLDNLHATTNIAAGNRFDQIGRSDIYSKEMVFFSGPKRYSKNLLSDSSVDTHGKLISRSTPQ
jgi:hypothetical protein